MDARLHHDLWMEEDSDADPERLDPGGMAAFNVADDASLSRPFLDPRSPLSDL